MELTKQELETFEIPYNLVLIKPVVDNSTITVGDLKLYIDTSHEIGKHANTVCEIVKVCDKLTPGIEDGTYTEEGCKWDCDVEAGPGDLGLVYFLSITKAFYGSYERSGHVKYDSVIEVDGEAMILVKYHDIYAVKRGEDVIPVNGWNFVRKVEKKKKHSFLTSDTKSDVYHEVVYPGKMNRQYFDYPEYSDGSRELLKGEIIHADPRHVFLCESDEHKVFFDETLYRVQLRSIYGVVDEVPVE